jgi:hypothetical protein
MRFGSGPGGVSVPRRISPTSAGQCRGSVSRSSERKLGCHTEISVRSRRCNKKRRVTYRNVSMSEMKRAAAGTASVASTIDFQAFPRYALSSSKPTGTTLPSEGCASATGVIDQ